MELSFFMESDNFSLHVLVAGVNNKGYPNKTPLSLHHMSVKMFRNHFWFILVYSLCPGVAKQVKPVGRPWTPPPPLQNRHGHGHSRGVTGFSVLFRLASELSAEEVPSWAMAIPDV
jgi:hypothetical protein